MPTTDTVSPPARLPAHQAWMEWIRRPRPRVSTALRSMLVVSIALHVIVLCVVPRNKMLSSDQLNKLETEYGKKITMTKRAAVAAREIANKITMPPPPPNPEQVIQSVLEDEIHADVVKVVKGLESDKVVQKLAGAVTKDLKNELKAAVDAMVAGKYSKEEIERFQKEFREKAQAKTLEVLQQHRVETQVDRAYDTTREWYEKEVAPSLYGKLRHWLVDEKYRDGNAAAWDRMYSSVAKGRAPWGLLSAAVLTEDVDYLERLITTGVLGADWEKKPRLPGWPGPGQQQAETISSALKDMWITKKDQRGTVLTLAWDEALNGSDEPCCDGLWAEYFPHKEADMRAKYGAKLDAEWKDAQAGTEEYLRQTLSGKSEAELKPAQKSCFDAIRKIIETTRETLKLGSPQCETINAALRLDVCHGPAAEKAYRIWVEGLAKSLQPLIKDYALGQFDAGILKYSAGVEKLGQEFAGTTGPLVLRDVEKMIAEKEFKNNVIYRPWNGRFSSKLTGVDSAPTDEHVRKANEEMEKLTSGNAELRAYAEKRREKLLQNIERSMRTMIEAAKQETFVGQLLNSSIVDYAEGANYEDRTQEALDARGSAKRGRDQDLADLTDGVPSVEAAQFALMHGASKGLGASLQPVMSALEPGYVTRGRPDQALRGLAPLFAPAPAKWGFEAQAEVKPNFKTPSPRFEAIPFLPNFPRLDQDLTAWGRVRPFFLKPQNKSSQKPVAVYAGWNYQGFFIAYHVDQAQELFYYPSRQSGQADVPVQIGQLRTGGLQRVRGSDWVFGGDHIRLFFDTLDARNDSRGNPHTQEFVILPIGTENNELAPGVERIIANQRDAQTKQFRGVKSEIVFFPNQPSPGEGPDGSGPYRITRMEKDGYTVQIFLPRTLFKTPIFAPGWIVGFDCCVATGHQTSYDAANGVGSGQLFCSTNPNSPKSWGDLMLLGGDPLIVVQDADETGTPSEAIVPGHSYLLTVQDPTRNVNLMAEDTVIVSVEAAVGNGKGQAKDRGDVKVFILKETAKNTGIFRGYINTQPGAGREVQDVLEVAPGQEVRIGYVGFADSKGKRNRITEIKLPVVATMMNTAAAKNP